MCGQYSFLAAKEALIERYQLNQAYADNFELDYALEESDDDRQKPSVYYPSGQPPILLPNRKIYNIQWGMTPSFAKRPLINARLETVLEKKTFREPFMKKRCIVPATCFYEWQAADETEGRAKTKYEIAVKDLPIFSMAGICERYADGKGGSYLTFAILTMAPKDQMAHIHDRMPVILEPAFEATYLDLTVSPDVLLSQLNQELSYDLLLEARP